MVSPADFRWLSFFGTAFPWLLLANVLLLIFWLWRWNRFALYHVLIIAFGWSHVTCFLGLNIAKNAVPASGTFTIATHNLGRMWGKVTTDQQYALLAEDYSRFLERSGAPDILCTQETRGKFYPLLAEKMGYEHKFNLKKGTVILSKYPMEAGGDIPFGKTGNSSLWVDVRIGKKLVRVYSVHLQSNKVTNDTEKVIEKGDLDEEKTWEDINRVLQKVGGATIIRAEQAERLRTHIEGCPHPVVLCGDLNDTPNSYIYRILSRGMTDTFQERGFGLGSTFAGVLPFLRIDYILTDPAIGTYACRTVRGPFSDHYPVVATLGIRN
jgi:endonuclease/exonuclease/phosphatase family metal-dependent hydrolase